MAATTIVEATAQPLDLPLQEPFEISLGTQYEASNVLVTVTTADGTTGYGEGSPLPPVTGETQDAALATAQAACTNLEDRDVTDYRAIVEDVRSTFPGMVSALFAVETAVIDAYCRHHGIAIAELFGTAATPVETDYTIPIVPPETAREQAVRITEAGFEHIKIKTGTDVATDIERVAAIAEVAADAELKVDANQGWTPKETERFAMALADQGIELALIEQPVPKTDIAGLARTRDRIDIPIAADESVFTPADAIRIVREEAADILNIKLGKSGLLGAGDIISIARGADLELMVGCMLESAIGIHASAHVVSGSDAFSYIDLDGNLLLDEDVVSVEGGPIHEINGPGHGITPDR
ncbi:MAG: dipeptide epimerase [Halobacteriales archaeon]